MVVFGMGLEVFREIDDTLGQYGYLYFGGPGVAVIDGILGNERSLALGGYRHRLLQI